MATQGTRSPARHRSAPLPGTALSLRPGAAAGRLVSLRPRVPGGLATRDRCAPRHGRVSLQQKHRCPLPRGCSRGCSHRSAFSAGEVAAVCRSSAAFNCSRCTVTLNLVPFLFLASELLLLFENAHTTLLRFTFGISYSHRFMRKSFIYFTIAVSAGASQRAPCRGSGVCPCPRWCRTARCAPRQRQVPGSPPRGTELSGDLAGDIGASVTPRLMKHQEDFG